MAEHADNPAGTDGFEFVEDAAPEPAALARPFERLGAPRAGDDMAFDFAALIAHAAKTRSLGAGTIIGSGTVANADAARGFCCILARRAVEIAEGAGRRRRSCASAIACASTCAIAPATRSSAPSSRRWWTTRAPDRGWIPRIGRSKRAGAPAGGPLRTNPKAFFIHLCSSQR